MPVHLEFTLHYLIQRSDVSTPRADRRLDGFESAIARLASRWRPQRPIAPARELRMADETREALLAWVEGGDPSAGRTLERLGVYASGAVTDDSVPEGWVRLRLNAGSSAH
jgi:hypothetical protein